MNVSSVCTKDHNDSFKEDEDKLICIVAFIDEDQEAVQRK